MAELSKVLEALGICRPLLGAVSVVAWSVVVFVARLVSLNGGPAVPFLAVYLWLKQRRQALPLVPLARL